jgi:hypothetical protein
MRLEITSTDLDFDKLFKKKKNASSTQSLNIMKGSETSGQRVGPTNDLTALILC